MLKAVDVENRYTTGGQEYIHVWVLVGGYPRCLSDALSAGVPAMVAAAIEASNAQVRESLTAVEAYEVALALTAGDPPPATIPGADDEGEPVQVDNPAWAEYEAALATIAAVTQDTLALHAERHPVKEPTDA